MAADCKEQPPYELWLEKVFVRLEASGDCLLWTGFVSTTSGYGMLRVPTNQPKSKRKSGTTMRGVHQIRLMCALHVTHFQPDYETSHLCHNKLCAKIDHVSLEPHSVNTQRRACVTNGRCKGHGALYKNCILNWVTATYVTYIYKQGAYLKWQGVGRGSSIVIMLGYTAITFI